MIMPAFKDLTGKTFGRLTALKCTKKATRKSGPSIWLCKCVCGNFKNVQSGHLVNGSTQSCGCLQREKAKESNIKHGMKYERLYNIYTNMLQRCFNCKSNAYKNYGLRGITVCKKWVYDKTTFFKWAISNGYTSKLTLERIDNNKGYSPTNCRWATREEQNRNKRSNVYIQVNGKNKILSDLAKEHGIKRKTLSYRIKSGWSLYEALTIIPKIGNNERSHEWKINF